jgi:hypothetical protein
LIHPDRLKFLRSPAPWVAIATLVIAMIPHLVWLKEVDFVPLTYAGDVYGLSSRAQSAQLVLGYIGHNLALLAGTGGAGGDCAGMAVTVGEPGRGNRRLVCAGHGRARKSVRECIAGAQYLDHPDRGRDRSAARRLDFHGLHEDRLGISLFFLTPLALVAIPSLRIQRIALFRIVAIWLVITLAALAASPYIAAEEMAVNPNGAATYGARSQLARELTQAWHTRFNTRWAVVAGTTEVG